MYFLNINKPKGMSSFDIIRILRKNLQIKQIGHSGTLDPLASGVLQVAVGKATKLLDYLSSDKTYIADIKFGFTTETLDSEADEIYVNKPEFSKNELMDTLNSFLGKSFQIPPKYSAIKQNGEKLCDLARKKQNIKVEIKPREINIYSIKLIDFNGFNKAKIKVSCAKGTYIRSLVRDIGEKLTCGAYMTDLVRIQAGDFKIENSKDPNNINKENIEKINPLDALKMHRYELNETEFSRIICGNFINIDKKCDNKNILLTKNNKLVSIAKIVDNQIIKPIKVFEGD